MYLDDEMGYRSSPLQEEVDYYMDPRGFRVFTEKYHRERGYCCGNGCRHCAFFPKHIKGNRELRE